jgi:ABC-type transporter Mla subunit MlaD
MNLYVETNPTSIAQQAKIDRLGVAIEQIDQKHFATSGQIRELMANYNQVLARFEKQERVNEQLLTKIAECNRILAAREDHIVRLLARALQSGSDNDKKAAA